MDIWEQGTIDALSGNIKDYSTEALMRLLIIISEEIARRENITPDKNGLKK